MHYIIDFFISKLRFTYVLLALLLLMGIFAYNTTPKELFPPIADSKISISGNYANGSIDSINKSIVSPIENDLKNVSGIKKIESKIQNNSFKIILSLDSNQDKTTLINDVKSVIDRNKHYFPKDFISPIVQKVVFSFPVGFISVYGEDKDLMIKLSKDIKRDLSSLPNISEVSIQNEKNKIIYITLKNKTIELLGLNKLEIISSISKLYNLNQLASIKNINGGFFASLDNTESLEEIENSIFKISNKYIYFKDIASIKDGYSKSSIISSYNLNQSMNISISKNKYGDAIQIRKKLLKVIDGYRKNYKNISFDYFLDTTVYIVNRLNTVVSNIIFGILLVFVCMYILINKRIALIVLIGIPTSFIIGMIFLKLSGYSINMITLLGALMILGVIVDDAIIVSENIQRHLEMGDDVLKSIKSGVREVFAPVMTASLTTILAFMPLLILSGELGAFIKMIPIAVCVLIIASLLECFLFLPIHAKHILSKNDKELNWDPVKNIYALFLSFLFKHKYKSFLSILIGIPLLSAFAFSFLKYTLFPAFDSSQFYVRGSFETSYSKEDVSKRIKKIEKLIISKKEEFSIKSISSTSGMRINSRGEFEIKEYYFDITIGLQEKVPSNFIEKFITPNLSFYYDDTFRTRVKPYSDIVNETKEMLEVFKNKDGLIELMVKKDEGGLVENDIEIQFFHKDKAKLENAVKLITKEIKKEKGILFVKNDINYGNTELKLKLNDYGKRLGITKQDLLTNLSPFYLDYEISLSSNEDGLIKVISKDINKNSSTKFKNFQIQSKEGFVRLQDICDFLEVQNYENIYKVYGQSVKSVFAGVNKDINTPIEVLDKINNTLELLSKDGISVSIKGEDEKNKQMEKEMSMSFMVAIFCIFITLLILFNSFRDSFLILSIIPLSFFGGVVGHLIMDIKMSMPSFIGLIGLSGVVINDAILMLSFVKNATNHQDVIKQASFRLRPIVITSLTTFAGLSTLIFFATGQAIILRPIAVSLGFGLLWGTLLTLIWLPLFYIILKRIKAKT